MSSFVSHANDRIITELQKNSIIFNKQKCREYFALDIFLILYLIAILVYSDYPHVKYENPKFYIAYL